jgi:general secretion pathway protein K
MTPPVLVRGYALVSVLWLVVLLTAIAAAYHAQARVEAQLLATAVQRAQAEAFSEAGIWFVLLEHLAANASEPAGRVTRTIDMQGTAITVTIADASGLINLNGAPPELLAALMAARSGLSAAVQATVVDGILDWRDSDSTRNPAGAEDDEYAASGAPHGAKDAPFATVDELRSIQGMTASAYRAISPALTVFGNHARINVAAAPPEVLAVLPRDRTGSFDQRFVQQTGDDIYMASAAATVGRVKAHVVATLRYAHGEQRPIQVLAWSNTQTGLAPPELEAAPHAP